VELRQLRYFVVVAEQLHFGRAAERLHIGQPAVSQQVRRLERELGVPLFDRSARLVRLTEAGQRFLPEARAVLAAADRAAAAAGDHASGSLRLGTSTGLGDRLDRVLHQLIRERPGVDVRLVATSTRARLERVRSGQLDAAFVRGDVDAPDLELVHLWQDELVAALPARHELAGEQVVHLAALAPMTLRMVSRSQNQPLVDLVIGGCMAAGFEPVMGPPSAALPETLALIGAGSSSWTVVYAAHARGLRSPHVAFIPLVEPVLAMPTLLAMLRSRSAELGALLHACRAIEDDHDS
jgi:DNA-binding transcriptional LysR family regulator